MPRPTPPDVPGRVHVLSEREDLVVHPTCAEDRFLRFVPAWSAGGELVLLPHNDPGGSIWMRDPHELPPEPLELDLAEREAQDEPVASVLRVQRELEVDHVELTGEMFDRAVVGRDAADAQGGHPGFRPQFRYDFEGRAHRARCLHRGSSLETRKAKQG